MDESKFNLWRATFSFCFVDGFLSPEETSYIEERLKSLALSPEQRNTLMQDLKSPPDIEKLFTLIQRPADRGILINNIRVLSRLDGLAPAEKQKIDALQKRVMERVNLEELNRVIAEDERASYHEDEVYKVDNKSSYIESTLKRLLKAMNPGDYKFPKS